MTCADGESEAQERTFKSQEEVTLDENSIPTENENRAQTKFSVPIFLVAIVVILILFAWSGDHFWENKRYSNDYKYDQEYRDNVDYVADVYDEDPAVVDEMIQDVVDEMNK
jgi:hypothetical protein